MLQYLVCPKNAYHKTRSHLSREERDSKQKKAQKKMTHYPHGLLIQYLCVFLCAVFLSGPVFAVEIHLAPEGNDASPGTSEQPFKTLARAQKAVREARKAAPNDAVTVTLSEGTYLLEKPLVFTPADSGAAGAPVTWRAALDSEVLITGGRPITGWEVGADGVWSVKLPQVANGEWYFTQLYVNGQARPRPRLPKEGFYHVAGFPQGRATEVHYHTDCDAFEFEAGQFDPSWRNLGDIDVIVYHYWTDSHLPIASINEEERIVTFKHKAGKVFSDFSGNGVPYVIDNVAEAFGELGQWYLDRPTGVLRYHPLPGEQSENTTVIAPFVPELLRLQGNPEAREYVEHIHFEGLNFAHTNWQLPPGNSNDSQGSASVPAAITLVGARDCEIRRCRISNIGTWAIELKDGCRNNQLVANEIDHVGGGAMRINGSEKHPLKRTGGNVISDNHIHHYGETYPSAVGVLLMHTEANRVAHNHIHHGYYTGVSVGWRWGYGECVARNNIIEANHIHDIGQGLLSDLGGIYTLGPQPGTILRRNHIHDIDASHYGGWGIYNDEGSSHILIESNIVHDTKYACYNIHFGRDLYVRNNIFACGRLDTISRGKVEPHRTVTLERNIVVATTRDFYSGNWKDLQHDYYIFPDKGKGVVMNERTRTFICDYNLYWNPELPRSKVLFAGKSWEAWQKRGQDRHSLYADPEFLSMDERDFTLKPDSPAFALGFEPIDTENIGPRVDTGP